MISFSCPRCNAFLTVDDHQTGSKYACAACGQVMVVPALAGAAHSGNAVTESARPQAPITPARLSGPHSAAADIRVVNGRQVVFWPCAHCRLGLNTPYENVGLSIQCPGCNEPVTVPDPIAAYHRDSPTSGRAEGTPHPEPLPRRKSALGLIAILAVTILILAGSVVALLIWQPWAQRTLSADQLYYLPDGSEVVATFDIQGLVNSEVYQKFDRAGRDLNNGVSLKQYEQMVKEKIGLGWSDLQRVTVGGKLNDRVFVAVVTTRKAVDARAILARLKQESAFDEVAVDRFKVFRSNGQAPAPLSFCVTEPTIVVFSTDLDVLKTVLTRNKGPVLAADLQSAMSRTDFSRTIAVAVGKPPADLNGLRKFGGDLSGGFARKLQGASVEIDTGATIDIKVLALCTDDKTAKELNDLGTGFLSLGQKMPTLPAEAKKLLDSIHISYRGAELSVTMSLDPDSIIELSKTFLGGRPFGLKR